MQLDLNPWLLPKDAFVNLQNIYVFQGALYKRRGSSLFSTTAHKFYHLLGTGDGNEVTFSWTLDTLEEGLRSIYITDGVEIFESNGAGLLVGDQGGTGTYNDQTGVLSVTFNTPPLALADVDMWWDCYHNDPIIGLWNHVSSSGTEQLLAFDTKRMNYWNDVFGNFQDPSDSDIFTGQETDFPWVCNWRDVSYICNGNDRIRSWNGYVISTPVFDIDGDANNEVDSAAFIFAYKDRLVLLRTQEDGTGHRQRARWSAAGTATVWDESLGAGYVDAPTNDWIIAAGFLKDQLVVWFERSVWILQYTGSSLIPFEWVRAVSQEGSVAAMSVQEFSDEQVAFGNVSIIGFDGQDTYNIADKLSNFILEMNQDLLHYSYGGVDEQRRQVFWTYAGLDATKPDRILVFNYDDNCWSVFALPVNCFGYFNITSSPTWADMDMDWEDNNELWLLRDFQAGFPYLLAGSENGVVLNLGLTDDDQGSEIYAEAVTAFMNPYGPMTEAVLGWVDLLVERNQFVDMTVEFFMNHELAPYLTQSVNFAGDDPQRRIGELTWVRIDCGAVGLNHQLKIQHSAAGNQFVIHAIVPYFKPAGVMR